MSIWRETGYIEDKSWDVKKAYIIHCSSEFETQRIGQPIQQKSVQYTYLTSPPDLFGIRSVEPRGYMPLLHIQISIISLQSPATLILSHAPQEIIFLYLLPPRLPHRCIQLLPSLQGLRAFLDTRSCRQIYRLLLKWDLSKLIASIQPSQPSAVGLGGEASLLL